MCEIIGCSPIFTVSNVLSQLSGRKFYRVSWHWLQSIRISTTLEARPRFRPLPAHFRLCVIIKYFLALAFKHNLIFSLWHLVDSCLTLLMLISKRKTFLFISTDVGEGQCLNARQLTVCFRSRGDNCIKLFLLLTQLSRFTYFLAVFCMYFEKVIDAV